MPKRKNAPKAKHATVDDLRDRGERIVHREAMTATVGDVLEAMHTDEAIKLLYAQDNLAAGRPLNDPVALMGETVRSETVDTAVERAREENAAEASRVSSQSQSQSSSSSPSVSPAAPAGLSRFLSPRFVVKATRDAVSELLEGVRQARVALGQATVRARQCFVPATE